MGTGPGADSWARYYHDSAAGFHGLLAPLAVVVGTVGALAALFAPRIVAFALGALVGLGASGAALHGGVLVRQADFSGSADRTGAAVLGLAAAASVLVAVVAARPPAGARRTRRPASEGSPAQSASRPHSSWRGSSSPSTAAARGRVLRSVRDPPDRWPDEAWAVFQPAVTLAGAWAAVAVAAAVTVASRPVCSARSEPSSACLAWRYIAVPIDLDDAFGSVAPGGFLGLAGALLLVAAARRVGRYASAWGVP